MAKTVVLPCTCENEFQDATYGRRRRLHNVDSTGKKASCTVCEGSARYNKRNSKASPPTTNRPSKNV